jgi:hypothetical protein
MFKLVPDHFVLILFFAVEKEYLARKDSRQNHQDDGAKRALIFNEVLKKLTVSAQKKANN